MDYDIFYNKIDNFLTYTSNKNLEKEIPLLDNNISREKTLQNFYKIYNEIKENNIKEKIYQSFLKFFGIEYFYLIIIRIFITITEFIGPIIIGKILHKTSQTFFLSEEEKNYSYFYIICFIVLTFSKIMVNSYYHYKLKNFRNQLEIIIPDLIYKKIFKLNSNVDNIKTEAEVCKILDEEISKINNFFTNLNYVWELPFSILFALYSTYLQVSFAFIPGFLFAICLLILNYKIALSITKTNENLHKPRLKRKENELILIKNIKTVKYFSIEKYLLNEIFYYRKDELNLLKFKKYLDALCCYLWAASPVLISFFSIFAYLLSGNLIDAEKVFTTISLLNMTIHPLNVFPWVFSSLKGSKKAIDDLIEFLNKDEVNNYNQKFSKNCNNSEIKIELKNLKIKYSKDSNFELEFTNENVFTVPITKKGNFTILYGPNGSGKSLILKSLLQETYVNYNNNSENFIYNKNLKINYVSQDLWTFQSTIKENIIMQKLINNNNYSHDEYKNILEKCCLTEDLMRIKNNDMTFITTKGSNISGGQKQRINIARAIYNNPDLLLLDNSFSSIDFNVSSKIIENCIIPLKEKGISIVLATSDKRFFKYSDYLYQIENKNLIKIINNNSEDNFTDYDYEKNKEENLNIPENNSEIKNNDQIIYNTKRINVSTLKFYFKLTGFILFAIVILFVALMQFGRNFIEIWLADWVKSKSEYLSTEEKFEIQKRNTKYYLLFVIIHSIFTIGRSALFAIAGLKACEKIYNILIEKIIYAKMQFFTKLENDLGKISNLLQNDIITIDEGLPFEFNRLLAYSFGLLGSIFVIIFSSFYSIFILIPVGFYYVKLFERYNPSCRLISKKVKEIQEPFLNLFYDLIEGRVIIRGYKKEEFFMQKFNEMTEEKLKILNTEQYLGFWLGLRLDLLAFYIYSFVIIMIGICIYRDQYGYITFLSLGLTYALNITTPLSSFLPWITITEEQFYSVERVLNKIEEIGENENNLVKNEIENLITPINDVNDDLIIEFKNVYFKYNNQNQNYNLEDVSLQIFKNQRVGIIGRTGAGKTTLFSTIFRLYNIQQGEILLNNKNIYHYDLDKIKENIVVIPKDYILFEGSIKLNIDPENKYTHEYLNEFLYQFKDLFTDKPEFEIFTKNLNTFKIENGGSNISEGIKSVIQIFRGLIKNSKIVCLDESNSELDDETENKLFKIIFERFINTTFIVISHKLNILKRFDYLIVVENGKIVESGVPNLILNKI